jgi:UDP-GlcNAc3NAcA epimerase
VCARGDTNSTLAGALAGAKLNVPVAHVEAGFRSFNRSMPEEINRIIADLISTLLLVPTEIAMDNLLREGVSRESIHHSGDVMLDAINLFREPALGQSVGYQSIESGG